MSLLTIPFSTLIIAVVCYFLVLIGISIWTSKGADSQSFFLGNRKAPWFLVAIGMIGASLSGVTFISVPGWVGATQFGYMQTVLGYMLGYLVIAHVLLPLYYRLNLTSIYTYLENRFGVASYKTGAAFFLLSRIIGASFRLFLVAIVLQLAIFDALGFPFAATVGITLLMIYIYTFKSGIKTIIYTDALQTIMLLGAVIASIYYLSQEIIPETESLFSFISNNHNASIFNWDIYSNNFFWKQFIGGAFIAMTMTGLDQDMMQKNLSVPDLGRSKRNIHTQMVLFILFNIVFLSLGVLLFEFFSHYNYPLPGKTDALYPTFALEYAPTYVGVLFLLGLLAAAYSSADSALTALTTSFCVDFLGFEKGNANAKTRYKVHIGFAVIIFITILIFKTINNEAVIKELFKAAGYTYGPLLGMFFFGILTKRQVHDKWAPWICVLSLALTAITDNYIHLIIPGYKIGFELLVINGLFTFTGFWLISNQAQRIALNTNKEI